MFRCSTRARVHRVIRMLCRLDVKHFISFIFAFVQNRAAGKTESWSTTQETRWPTEMLLLPVEKNKTCFFCLLKPWNHVAVWPSQEVTETSAGSLVDALYLGSSFLNVNEYLSTTQPLTSAYSEAAGFYFTERVVEVSKCFTLFWR